MIHVVQMSNFHQSFETDIYTRTWYAYFHTEHSNTIYKFTI